MGDDIMDQGVASILCGKFLKTCYKMESGDTKIYTKDVAKKFNTIVIDAALKILSKDDRFHVEYTKEKATITEESGFLFKTIEVYEKRVYTRIHIKRL